MEFTREPIIETVITPKEGCKLVVRSSKTSGQEEYFVDAVEVISFGNSLFFRSTERPKAFLVPVSDYEILEVREARMVLKNVGVDRANIKIGGGRDAQMRPPREQPQERQERNERQEKPEKQEKTEAAATTSAEGAEATPAADGKQPEKKRDRRRQYRRRRGRDGSGVEEEDTEEENKENAGKVNLPEPRTIVEGEEVPVNPMPIPSVLTSLLPPPPTLISETIARYKDNALFRDAFYSRGDEKVEDVKIHETETASQEPTDEAIPLPQPAYGSFEVSEQEEEAIYQQRKRNRTRHDEEEPTHDSASSHENPADHGHGHSHEAHQPVTAEPQETEVDPQVAPDHSVEPHAPHADDIPSDDAHHHHPKE